MRQMKAENKELKENVNRFTVNRTELVPIYSGAPLKMEPICLSFITGANRDGSIIRNMMRYYFTDLELRTSTVSGKLCHANQPKEGEPLQKYNKLDAVKFNAIMGKHRSPRKSLAFNFL
jgi:hypothetical protein